MRQKLFLRCKSVSRPGEKSVGSIHFLSSVLNSIYNLHYQGLFEQPQKSLTVGESQGAAVHAMIKTLLWKILCNENGDVTVCSLWNT